jgi:hypothetical protein
MQRDDQVRSLCFEDHAGQLGSRRAGGGGQLSRGQPRFSEAEPQVSEFQGEGAQLVLHIAAGEAGVGLEAESARRYAEGGGGGSRQLTE